MVTYDSQSSEAEKAFKQLLILKARATLTRYEVEGNLHLAGRFAIVLDDYVSQKRVLSRIMSQYKIEPWEYETAGLLAIAIGDIGLAERIIRELENTNNVSLEWRVNEGIVNIAIRLPNKASARRVMRLFEDKGDNGQVLNIAAAIGDRQTCEILMWKMVEEGRTLYHIKTEWLVTAALYDPVVGKN